MRTHYFIHEMTICIFIIFFFRVSAITNFKSAVIITKMSIFLNNNKNNNGDKKKTRLGGKYYTIRLEMQYFILQNNWTWTCTHNIIM